MEIIFSSGSGITQLHSCNFIELGSICIPNWIILEIFQSDQCIFSCGFSYLFIVWLDNVSLEVIGFLIYFGGFYFLLRWCWKFVLICFFECVFFCFVWGVQVLFVLVFVMSLEELMDSQFYFIGFRSLTRKDYVAFSLTAGRGFLGRLLIMLFCGSTVYVVLLGVVVDRLKNNYVWRYGHR